MKLKRLGKKLAVPLILLGVTAGGFLGNRLYKRHKQQARIAQFHKRTELRRLAYLRMMKEQRVKQDKATLLDEAMAQFPKREHRVLSNLWAFYRIGNKLSSSERGKEFLAGKKELNVLYPGSGVHLSPIELAVEVAKAHPHIGKINFTYTEISWREWKSIDKDFRTLVGNVAGLSFVSSKRVVHAGPESDSEAEKLAKKGKETGRERVLKAIYRTGSGREVELGIRFAFRMSGKDHYSQADFDQADILLSHDITDGMDSPADAVNMYLRSFGRTEKSKDRILLIEYRERQNPSVRFMAYGALGEVESVEAPYGCGPNHLESERKKNKGKKVNHDGPGKAEFNSAAIVYLDTGSLEAIGKSGKDAVKSYVALLSFEGIPDKENGQIEIANREDGREEKENRKVRKLMSERLADVLPAVMQFGGKARTNLSKNLISILAGNFTFDALSNESLLPYWRVVVKDYLENYSRPKFSDGASKFFSNPFRSKGFNPVMHQANELLIAHIIGKKTGDGGILAKLKEITNREIRSITGSNELMSSFFRPRIASDRLVLAGKKEGLFVPKLQKHRRRVLQLISDLGVCATATVLYVGRDLDCEAAKEFVEALDSQGAGKSKIGSERTYTDFLREAALR